MATIALAVASGSALAALAIGAVLTGLVYMGRPVSGAHYNPAVTLAVWVRGRCEGRHVLPYVLVQMLAAGLASALAHAWTGRAFVPTPGAGVSVPAAIAAEAVFTFALVSVILHVATHRQTAGNGYYGAAIGFTVAGAIVAIGPVSGCALNPAVGVGTALYGVVAGTTPAAPPGELLLIYSVGPIAGGLLAAGVFKLTAGPGAD